MGKLLSQLVLLPLELLPLVFPLRENLPDVRIIRQDSLVDLRRLIDGLHDPEVFRIDPFHVQIDLLQSLRNLKMIN